MDFYVILGLERAATLGDVKRAYRRLARRFHPDINPGDRTAAAHFRQIAEAYETLSDPDRRRRYDTVGPAGPSVQAAAFGFEGFDFSASVNGASAPTFGDLFADVLQQRRADTVAAARRRSASDDHAQLRRRDARRRAATDGHPPRAVPHLPRHRPPADGGEPVPAVSRRGRREVGARAHGVLQAVFACAAALAVRRKRGAMRAAAAGRGYERSR